MLSVSSFYVSITVTEKIHTLESQEMERSTGTERIQQQQRLEIIINWNGSTNCNCNYKS